MKRKKETARKLTESMVTVVVLTICLCINTLALIYASISIEDNLFHTGNIKINLNDGKPVIEEHEFLFEPGMTVKKEFFIENLSTWDVYYKLYMDHVEGGLSDILEITVKDGEKVLYQGTASSLSSDQVSAAVDTLKIKEKRNLAIYFHFPETAGNQIQDRSLSFDLCADAVQTKNNPKKEF